MILLGIDYGQAKMGLALAEDFLAQPYGVLANNKNLLAKIGKICHQQAVKKIVVGLPEGTKVKTEVKSFARRLRGVLRLPVEFHPETLTTQEAIAKMIAAGKRRKKRRQQEDAFAAALILQDYLEKER